jgi:hypothetical protein
LVKSTDPGTPKVRKAFSGEDPVKGIPADRVKSLTEVQLENSSRSSSLAAGLHNVSRINKVFSDAASGDEPRLVRVDKIGNKVFKPKSETFGVNFKTAVLEGDRPKIVRFIGPSFFGQKDNVGFVDGAEIGREAVEAREGSGKGIFNQFPVLLEKSRAKTVGTRAGIVVHREEGSFYFSHGERPNERVGLRGGEGGRFK